MSQTDDKVGMAFVYVITIACVGGLGVIWIIDLALTSLSPLLAILTISLYSIGILGVILLGFFYITGGSIFATKKVALEELRKVITFLDMLCQGITQLGYVTKAEAPKDMIDPNAMAVRSSTTALLLKINSSFAKKWAKTVEKEEPLWRLIIEVSAATTFGFIQTGEFLLLVGTIIVSVMSFIASTSALVELTLIGVIIVVLLISILIFRIYKGTQQKELDSLVMVEQSYKGLQMVFELAKKQTPSKTKLYVLGNYEFLSYTGNILKTSEGRELKEAFLITGGE